MTTASAPPRLITAAEFLEMELPPGKRYELIRGVVTGEYDGIIRRCGVVVSQCGGTLYLHTEQVGGWHSAMGDPGYILERNPDTVRSVDIALIAEGRIPPGTKGFPELAPDLCIEAAYTQGCDGQPTAFRQGPDVAGPWRPRGLGTQPGGHHANALPPRPVAGDAGRG